MDLAKVLAQLREELDTLNATILSLERLQQRSQRRDRPPRTVAAAKPKAKPVTALDRRGASDPRPPASDDKGA
jgi:hypothetical protein